jgi:alpha-galactosidase
MADYANTKGFLNMTTNARWIAGLLAAGIGLARTAQAQQGGKSPVQVFILAGQSNMEGHGEIKPNPNSTNGGKGTLEYLIKDPATAARFKHVVAGRSLPLSL